VELMDWVGPGGHYLHENHTLKHFRNVWYSKLFDRSIYAQWLNQGAKRFEERLCEQTQKAMEHTPAPLSPDIVRELERMAQSWK
ncbi:MAG TPA: trimethylamine methyltransferase family protein, partial [Anaerolineae bacterium]|nr:trimethylamine methyltransferase family protein [Anaerolineae bacterium]